MFYMFIILISMSLSFMLYFLNRICLFSCFLFGGIFPNIIIRTNFFHIYFSIVNIIITVDSCKSWSYCGILPFDIEQWRAEIGRFNGNFLGVIIKLELYLLNIISSLNQVVALICTLLFQYISNADSAFYFLTTSFVFALSAVV